jgi:MFS family permease
MRASVLRYANYRMLWLGQTLSAVGDPIFPFAVAYLAIRRGDNAIGVASVLGARALATTCVVLAGGVLADRFKRTRVMIFSDATRLIALVGIAMAPGNIPLAVLSVLVFVVGLGEATFRPAYSALVPSLVPEDRIQAANALTSLSLRTAGFVGPALAALLVSGISARGALLVDAATFGVSILTLLAVREPVVARTRDADESSGVLTDVREGFRAVVSRRWLALEIGAGAVQITAALAPWLVLLPIVTNSALGGPGAYAALLVAMSGGSVLGAFLGGRIKTRLPGVVASVCLVPFTVALVGLAQLWPLPVLIVLHVAAGIGTEIYGVLWTTAIQRGIPAAVLGRVFALDQLGSLALLPVGMMFAGALAGRGSATPVLLVAALVNLVTALGPLVFPEVRVFRDRPRPRHAAWLAAADNKRTGREGHRSVRRPGVPVPATLNQEESS